MNYGSDLRPRWSVARRESFAGYTLETLRQRSGPGAHRVRYNTHTLFVGPSGATSSRARRGRIVAALARPQGEVMEPMFQQIMGELRTIGAYDFEIDGHTAGLGPRATHQRRVPAGEYLDALRRKSPREFDKLRALLEMAAEIGPQNIKNKEKIKALGQGLFEFKSYQARLFWCYGQSEGSKRTVLLLDGATKKKDRHRPSDLVRARKLMRNVGE